MRIFPNRIAALLAAEEISRKRGFTDEEAKKHASAFPEYDQHGHCLGYSAWAVHSLKPNATLASRTVIVEETTK